VKSLTLGSKQLASLFDSLVEGFLVCDRDDTEFPTHTTKHYMVNPFL